jgi:hypothetical protein
MGRRLQSRPSTGTASDGALPLAQTPGPLSAQTAQLWRSSGYLLLQQMIGRSELMICQAKAFD